MTTRKLLTVNDVEAAHARGDQAVAVARGTIVTPLARDVARRLDVRLEAREAKRRPAIFGNWKAHGTARDAVALARAVARGAGPRAAATGRDVAVFPPFPHLAAVGEALAGSAVALGAQDVSPRPPGATTGAVPAAMLRDLGVTWVLVGHSERRALLGDTDALVRTKLRRALEAELRPVLCVGETLAEREAGRTHSVLRRQLLHALDRLDAGGARRLALAYEPVWAIGSGLTPEPAEIESCLGALRDHVARRFDDRIAEAVPVLYGGSVKPSNATAILSLGACDGALVGGASLDADAFAAIAEAG